MDHCFLLRWSCSNLPCVLLAHPLLQIGWLKKCENHARKMRTFFTRRLEPKTRSSYHIKWSNAKWNTLKQNTSSLLKTKLSQNYSTLTQVRSRTKESKLTLHAVVVFWIKQTKQGKHRVGTPSIPSRERTTPREPKFHTPSCSSAKLPQIWAPDNGKLKFQANLLSLQPNYDANISSWAT